eukprot:gene9855-18440_t
MGETESMQLKDHFGEENFLRKCMALLGPTERLQAVLKRDDFGTLDFPTVYPIDSSALVVTGESTRPKPKRSKAHRQVNIHPVKVKTLRSETRPPKPLHHPVYASDTDEEIFSDEENVHLEDMEDVDYDIEEDTDESDEEI